MGGNTTPTSVGGDLPVLWKWLHLGISCMSFIRTIIWWCTAIRGTSANTRGDKALTGAGFVVIPKIVLDPTTNVTRSF